MKKRTLVIAEAGVNHNGSAELAFKLIDAAASAGADFVKFQTFKSGEIADKSSPMADYQVSAVPNKCNQLDMLKNLELSREFHFDLAKHCQKKGVKFLSTAFDPESLQFLSEELAVELIKIPSGEICNPFLLIAAGSTKKTIILSTGMAVLADIELALGALAYGMLGLSDTPSESCFYKIYCSEEGQKKIAERVILLHCSTEYPADYGDINLRAMDTLAAAFELPVGLSDHSQGILIPVAAVARGAVVIEKHFTLDRNLPGPDHKASLLPEELTEMIRNIRNIESALGNGKKIPADSELKNKTVVRRSIVALEKIEKGSLFCERNIGIRRPGKGLSPMRYWEVIGRVANRTFEKGDFIEI